MEIGEVIGNVWATKKADGIEGKKLLIIRIRRQQDRGKMIVAADVIGAGVGDTVLVCQGTSARLVVGDGTTPVDAAIVGIVDSLDIPG